MPYTIAKRFDFSASHILDGLPDGHQCGRLHGHNYSVEVELSAVSLPPGPGFVHDYGALAPIKRYIDDTLDHRHLNDVVNPNPTAEHLAHHLWHVASSLLDLPPGVTVSAVRVHETPKTVAEYRP